MIDRRVFLGTLGASAAWTAVPLWHCENGAVASSSRKHITLNGEWKRYVGGRPWDIVTVPSSLRPSGFYSLKRDFVLSGLSARERAFLHFEGITYCGKLSMNGGQLGVLGPYVPYEFEVTDFVRNAKNEVEVQIADLVPWPDSTGKYELAIGVNQGWEAYSGIIRDAWLEIRPASFVENVRLAYQLDANLQSVTLQPRVIVASRDACSGKVKCVLLRNGTVAAETSRPAQFSGGLNESKCLSTCRIAPCGRRTNRIFTN